jgi:type I restriction enzyme M protein
MFAQHMLSVLKTDGMMATVMPHEVLFRGGEEKKIRESFIQLLHPATLRLTASFR